ncbi:MAG: alpha/beta hydrolase [Actinomycetota bacterium]|nr:alpha/beta hydrolase [Actinomycetota bacterium]
MLDEAAPRLWPGAAVDPPYTVPATRLATANLRLSDGQRVGVAVGGRGIPLVVAHGFSFAGMVYVQSLSRLASMGFKVIAVDLAGHGGSGGLGERGYLLDEYRLFLGRVLDELGVERAVLAGHSLGGRLVADLGAAEPERAVALLLIGAATGRTWDDLAAFSGWSPPVLGLVGATLVADTLGAMFLSGNQSAKLQALALPQTISNVFTPWRLMAPALSVLLAPASGPVLKRLRAARVPVIVLHGDRDPVVPLAAARDTAAQTGGELVVVHGAGHSWVLDDPETVRAIAADLLSDGLGTACVDAVVAAGLEPDTVSLAEVERAFYAPGALVHRLTPRPGQYEMHPAQLPRYRWTRLATPALDGRGVA